MNERITKKWTKTTAEAFGNTPEVEKGIIAEQMYHAWADNVYDDVIYYESERDMQVQGIDFEIKMDHWSQHYGVDVKGNLKSNGNFLVDNTPDGWLRGKSKTNHRVCHICADTGWAIEYDRLKMVDFLSDQPEELVPLNSMQPEIKHFTRRFKVN